MCEHRSVNGHAVTEMRVMVPKPIYDQLAEAFSQGEMNSAVVDSLKESLRKRRFHRDLERIAKGKSR